MGSRNKTAARYLCQLLDYDENSKTYPITGTPNTGFTVTYRQNGSTVILDNAALEKKLDSSTEGASTIIPIDKNGITTARVVLKNVEDMAKRV